MRKGSSGDSVRTWQKFLLKENFYYGVIDGNFGAKTEAATKLIQKQNGLGEDGIVGPKTWALMLFEGKLLQEVDFENAAREIGCEIDTVKTVCEVEAPRGGFLSDGRPVILFEAHKFHKHTNGKYDNEYPNISSKVWNKSLYFGEEKEYKRLEIAKNLDKAAAYKSASWGKFQILGENFRECGFTNVFSFVDAMIESEGQHLSAFVKFVKAKGLVQSLIDKNWEAFARGYNGPGYEKNSYHIKMEEAYNKLKNKI
ncbi:MAG: hypothetical protein A2V66_07225 [Ignavibacteria bacterium RBG_13_36_8]|nr:MAG: hypothetical protein A2V66_07225 [Ignavibacteria bacterium RBG_13_36_8]